MAKCEVCGRPATTQLTVRENGRARQLSLCDEHYAELMGDGGFGRSPSSPLESLFHGGMFDEFKDFFGDRGSLFGDRDRGGGGRGGGGNVPISSSRGGARPAAGGGQRRQ